MHQKEKKKERRRRYELGLFALFAIVALLFWGWGAFAAWRGKRPAVVYTFTCLGLVVFFSFIVGMWISLERPPMRTMGETRLWYSFFFRWRESSLTAVGSINGFSVSVPFVTGVCLHQYIQARNTQ